MIAVGDSITWEAATREQTAGERKTVSEILTAVRPIDGEYRAMSSTRYSIQYKDRIHKDNKGERIVLQFDAG